MSADWKSEWAILRDLAIAQGNVPVENVEAVYSDQKPPSLHIDEETEEHFLQQYITDAYTNVTPDLGLIQEMLEKVRDVRVNEIDSPECVRDETETIPKTPEDLNSRLPRKSTKVECDKSKHNRNAAVESLLGLKNKEVRRVKKTNSAIPIVVTPENMFKAKTSKSVDLSKNDISKNVVNDSMVSSKVRGPPVFVPSSTAQEYYEKVMEKKKQKELVEENIWTRAERQMKEIEAKRKQLLRDD